MIRFSYDVQLDSPVSGTTADAISAVVQITDKGGSSLRRTLTVPANKWTTLDAGEIAPWFWLVMNVHESADVQLGFGTGAPIMVYHGGTPCIWTGATPPVVRGVGGESKVLYWVVSAT